MTQDIKFRAWCQGVMYPVLGLFWGDDFIDVNIGTVDTVDVVDWRSSKDLTLMQFTGLKDKNSVEIYESDILKFLNDELYVVNFRSGCFMADNIRNGKALTHDKEDVRVWHTLMESQMLIKIIGNIHQRHTDLNS